MPANPPLWRLFLFPAGVPAALGVLVWEPPGHEKDSVNRGRKGFAAK